MILKTMPKVNVEIGALFKAEQSAPYMVLMAGGELLKYEGTSLKAGVQKTKLPIP